MAFTCWVLGFYLHFTLRNILLAKREDIATEYGGEGSQPARDCRFSLAQNSPAFPSSAPPLARCHELGDNAPLSPDSEVLGALIGQVVLTSLADHGVKISTDFI